MTNAWSLLYDELYGDKEMTDENKITPQESDEYDPIIGTGNTAYDPIHGYPMGKGIGYDLGGSYEYEHSDMWYDYNRNDDDATNPFIDPKDHERAEEVVNKAPGIKDSSNRKYNEDQSIEALKEYVSSTYGGHYTSDNNNVQTLDLIESVGDAEAFCRSNAIKYLSRYDKKGQAKRDILKALHYSLLLYHFSGQLNETPTRGYETF